MHISFLHTFVLVANLVYAQESNTSASFSDVSSASVSSSNTLNAGESIPQRNEQQKPSSIAQADAQGVVPTTSLIPGLSNSSPGSVTITSSDSTSTPMATAGTSSMMDSSSGLVQSTPTGMSTTMVVVSGSLASSTTGMSTTMVVASGSLASSTANASNTNATSAPTTALDKKNVAGHVFGFVDTAGILLLIGILAGL